jgi:hypothetical protein
MPISKLNSLINLSTLLKTTNIKNQNSNGNCPKGIIQKTNCFLPKTINSLDRTPYFLWKILRPPTKIQTSRRRTFSFQHQIINSRKKGRVPKAKTSKIIEFKIMGRIKIEIFPNKILLSRRTLPRENTIKAKIVSLIINLTTPILNLMSPKNKKSSFRNNIT